MHIILIICFMFIAVEASPLDYFRKKIEPKYLTLIPLAKKQEEIAITTLAPSFKRNQNIFDLRILYTSLLCYTLIQTYTYYMSWYLTRSNTWIQFAQQVFCFRAIKENEEVILQHYLKAYPHLEKQSKTFDFLSTIDKELVYLNRFKNIVMIMRLNPFFLYNNELYKEIPVLIEKIQKIKDVLLKVTLKSNNICAAQNH